MSHSIKKHLEKNSNWREIKSILQKISRKGFQALVVGGAIRDALLNREVKEIDLASSAKPEELLKIFPQAGRAFKKYGVIFIPLKDKTSLEIATFRKDSRKSDGRRPEYVEYGALEHDFKRRDFTINALYYDFQKDEVLDFTEGRKHLKEKKIKTIGRAEDRFKEDYLRMLRALRFESQLGFKLDPEIKPAVKNLKQKIQEISQERVTEEIHKVFSCGKTLIWLVSLRKHGLFNLVFPGLDFNKIKSYLSLLAPPALAGSCVQEEADSIKNLIDRAKKSKVKKTSLNLKESLSKAGDCIAVKNKLKNNIVLYWTALGLSSFYGSGKNFQSFLKKYALSSRLKKEILSYFNSVEALLKNPKKTKKISQAEEKSRIAEKWLALNGRAGPVYELSRALLLQAKKASQIQNQTQKPGQKSNIKAEGEQKSGAYALKNTRHQKKNQINITEKQLRLYLTGFQKRAKNGKLPKPLLRGADLLKIKPPLKKECFSKLLKKAYHIQLIHPERTKKDLLSHLKLEFFI